MKIAPAVLRAPFAAPNPVRGDQTASFAELLEGGADVGTLLSQRALGFAEAGLLGAHYARDVRSNGDSQADPQAMRGVTGEAALPKTAAASERLEGPSAAEAGSRGRPLFAGTDTPPGAPRRLAAQPARPAPLPDASEAAALTPAEPDTVVQAEEAAPVHPTYPDRRHARRNSAFQVTALGKAAELTIIVDGADAGDGSISNLEETARAVASEYGVAIGRLIVRPTHRGTKG